MQQDFIFSVSHPDFYESLTHYPTTPVYRDAVREALPEDWRFDRSGPWLNAFRPGTRIPPQGFKIHLSSTRQHAPALLGVVARECGRRNTPFKFAADPGLLGILNAKGYDRGGGGKFVTIYPADEAAFVETIEALYQATREEPFEGPYILSDRRYRDSKVLYYRYGGFHPVQRLSVDGTRTHLVAAPDGTLVPDVRAPFFQLPPWVRDPFPSDAPAETPSLTLGGRFTVQSLLTASNRGGVYVARDEETGETVVLKEARPHINRMTVGGVSMDGFDFLRNEFRVLRRLEPLGCTPRPVAIFEEWEHIFLAQEKIEGMGLKRFMAQHENLALPYIDREGVLAGFLPRFRSMALSLIDAVSRIHALGVILGDLSINNVMVEPATLRVVLIDVESAVAVDEDPDFARVSFHWFTPGFAREERDRGTAAGLEFADDHYGLGMVLFNMFVGGIQFTAQQRGGRERLLAKLVSLGVPEDVREAIEALFAGDLAAAAGAVRRLPAA